MFAKLLLIILATGAAGCVLLVNRQQRLDTAAEISHLHGRLLEAERSLWNLRSEIAADCQLSQLRSAMGRLSDAWTPIQQASPPAGGSVPAQGGSQRMKP